jgi:hypothetical protein
VVNIRALVAVAVVFADTIAAAPLEKSVSTSREFIVYGRDRLVRAAICDLAERAKRNLLALLQARDDWKTPVVVHAELRQADAPDAPAAQTTLSQTGFGLKLQVDLAVGADSGAAAVERELLRATLTEMMYRGAADTPPGAAYVQPPDWLIEGVLALAPDQERDEYAASFEGLSAPNASMSLPQFLQQRCDALEPPLRVVYRGCAAALLSMLIESPGGRGRLAAFLARLPSTASDDPFAQLQADFPQLGSSEAEWTEHWLAAAARLGTRERGQVLSCEESERELARLVNAAVPDSASRGAAHGLDEFPAFVQSPAAAAALRHLSNDLLVLSGHANPLYAPIIAEYRRVTLLLLRRKTKHIAERLARLRANREEISRRMSAIGDYLNWFEATQLRTRSGAFTEFLQTAEVAAERDARRRDPISVYLDALEAQLGD